MTRRQWRVVAVLTARVFAGLAVIFTAACHNEAVVPQDTFTPWGKETRPLFTSCAHARQAGVPLPLQVGDPGWNPRLDRDHNGLAC